MKTTLKAIIFTGSLLAVISAFAGEQTVTLEVSGMTCAACPYIVKQTLADVDGVTSVDVSFAEKIALVTYDDSKTEVVALTLATTDMGFPSSLKE
jgi:mercuric ion binding protein